MNGKQTYLNLGDETPSGFDRFLWWLSTAETELIYDCVVDRNRYRIVGYSVFGTWLFATLAWAYFFSTAIAQPWVYLTLGLFMGFIILTIDRTLIKGITRSNKNKLAPLLFRALLALTIGVFMAQPAILFLFQKEIRVQANIDNEGRKQTQRQVLDSSYKGQISTLNAEKAGLLAQLNQQNALVEKARAAYLAETDGTGGSGQRGISTIALAKRAEYQKLALEKEMLQSKLQPRLDSMDSRLIAIEQNIQLQQYQFDTLLNEGFLTQIAALENLLKTNTALATRYYLVVIILMLIELMPVIAKTLLPSGVLDEKIRLREAFETDQNRDRIKREEELMQQFYQQANQEDRQTIEAFFQQNRERRKQKMDKMGENWKVKDPQSFEQLWQQVKRNILIR